MWEPSTRDRAAPRFDPRRGRPQNHQVVRAFLVAVVFAVVALLGANADAHLRAHGTDIVRDARVVHGSAEPFRATRAPVVLRDVRAIVEERRGAERPRVADDARATKRFAKRPAVRRPSADARPWQWRGEIEPPPPRG